MIRVFVACFVLASTVGNSESLSFANNWFWKVKESDKVGSGLLPKFGSNNSREFVKLSAGDAGWQNARFGVRGQIGERYFSVDERTGVVKLKTQFDYEVGARYRAKFYVTADGYEEVENEAVIDVIDVNDNAPQFEKATYRKSVREDTRPGSVLSVRATDLDTGIGGVVEYYLEGAGRIPFRVHRKTGQVQLERALDCEVTPTYRFQIRAKDKGRPRLSSTTQVIIDVTDVQDTDPIFLGLPYDISVPEDTPEGSFIVKLRAVDGDRGPKNYITYSIVSGDEGGRFMITGRDVGVARSLDREEEGFPGVYSITVKAVERGSSGSADVTFNVTVVDVDDNSPIWSDSFREIDVSEVTRVGTRLLTLEVKDLDLGENSEMSIFVEREFSSMFAVSPAIVRGQSQIALILNEQLDFEERSKIKLKIFANQTFNPNHYARCDVTINIENANDNRPLFDQTVYRIEVPENVTSHEPLVKVRATDADLGEFGIVTYSIKSPSKVFGISPENGEIYLVESLDRETIQQYSVLVSATDGVAPSATATVIVRVTDVNDNSPHFAASSYVTQVEENLIPDTPISILWAADADEPPSNEIEFHVTNSEMSGHFTIMKTRAGFAEVTLTVPLDFESVRGGILTLTIVAVDSGTPRRNSTVPLVVRVQDTNDNNPEFLKNSSKMISIPENVAADKLVGSVLAEDRDSGSNGRVRFYAIGSQHFDRDFLLDESSGEISVRAGSSLDYETMSRYDVTIVAEDYGSPPRLSRHNLRIDLEDVNDCPPVFEQSRYEVTHEENTTPALVVSVSATDGDSGKNGEVVYSIIAGNEAGIFRINSSNGEISAIEPLDYESSFGCYAITVEARDQAVTKRSRLSASTDVFIHVTDSNDNAPVFKLDDNSEVTGLLSYDVTEGSEGTLIGEFEATDDDVGRNGVVSFHICAGNEDGLFEISASSGLFRVSEGRILDREAKAFHDVTICATDAGRPSLTSEARIRVNVIDTNDNAPVFENFRKTFRVSESANVMTIVGTVQAIDRDQGENGRVRYAITNDHGTGTFYVDQNTGDVILAKPLDRETREYYDVDITARDNPNSRENSKSTKLEMKIVIDDVNDNSPEFVGTRPYEGAIPENSLPGSLVSVTGDIAAAQDGDLGSNGSVTYTIVHDDVTFVDGRGTPEGGLFAINSQDATVSIRNAIDRESLASDVISLVIRASDGGERFSDATLRVTIQDLNDNSPRFRHQSQNATIREDATPGTEVIRLMATDADRGKNSDIRYKILSGSHEKFDIEPTTGVVRVVRFIDREIKSDYVITVVATDNAGVKSLSTTSTLRIFLDDVNDSRPRFDETKIRANVKENSDPGYDIFRVHASDSDLDASIRYRITELTAFDSRGFPARSRDSLHDKVESWFSLDESAGIVTTKSPSIDRELCSRVRMVLSAVDLNSANDEYAASLESAFADITIEDENDNAPVFFTSDGVTKLKDELIVDVTEESAIGSKLVAISAVDYDVGDNGRVVYEITEGRGVELRNSEIGVIFQTARIDRESMLEENGHAWMNVSVIARDLGDQTSRLKISIRVIDSNDNIPRFDFDELRASVREDSVSGSVVETVKAIDGDSGDFGTVSYSLKGGNDVFAIDSDSGSITLQKPLDRELISSYRLMVIATDNARGFELDRHSASAMVFVLVSDVNDCTPEFIEPRREWMTASTKEDAAVGSLVGVVKAIDRDEGVGGHITYSLKKNDLSEFFDILPSGHIKISRALTDLDRNLTEPKLEVIAIDGGGLSSSLILNLDIVDVNDHAPTFPKSDNSFYIEEEDIPGTYVGEISASDSDDGLNGMVRYSFCDETQEGRDFAVDEVTGRIVTAKRLDREQKSTHSIQFCAKDLGLPVLASSVRVSVHLLDVNDNAPKFARTRVHGAFQEMSVSESLQSGESAGEIARAIDHDEGGNAHVFYHLLYVASNGREMPGMFSLRHREIVIEENLDREKNDRYQLIVKATNSESLSTGERKFRKSHELDPSADDSLLEIVIVIDDVNDESPVFTETEYVTAVDVGAPPGHHVISVKATDKDLHDSLRYYVATTELLSHDNKTTRVVYDALEIRPEDGALTLARSVEGYRGRLLKAEVRAVDEMQHRASTHVLIFLLRDDDMVRFVINSPSSEVRAKKDDLSRLLASLTQSRVMIDHIDDHVSASGRHDNLRSDVTMRFYCFEDSNSLSAGDLKKKLESKRERIEEMFGSCALIQEPGTSSLQIIVIVMLALLFLIVILFSVLYYFMQRRYKRHIKALNTDTLKRQPTPEPASRQVRTRGSYPTWKEEYFRVLSQQQITEEAEYFTDSDRPRSTTSHKRGTAGKMQRADSIPRSSTDVRIQDGHLIHANTKLIQKSADRKNRRSKLAGQRRERACSSSKRSSLSRDSRKSKSFKKDFRVPPDALMRDSTSSKNCKSDDSRSNASTVKEVVTKHGKERDKELVLQSPELSLHSGGTSEELKRTLRLHGSDASELEHEYVESDEYSELHHWPSASSIYNERQKT